MKSTFDFLVAVLPDEGYPVLTWRFTRPDGSRGWTNRAYTDIRKASGMAKFLCDKGNDVYFACATYTDVTPTDKPDAHYVERTQVNVHALKAFYGDIDVKADESHYRTKREAVDALVAFCQWVGLPRPVVVNSGGGIHFYWILRDRTTHAEWFPAATALKAAMVEFGLQADVQVTADAARILRPVGTYWKKEQPHRQVSLVGDWLPDEDELKPLAWYLDKLSAWHDPLATAALYSQYDMGSDDMSAGLYPEVETDADKLADECIQAALVRDSGGDVGYEHWRHVLGLLKHCEDSEKHADHWTRNREATGHDSVDWHSKMESWTTAPPRCTSLDQVNPGVCQGCPHWGKINTPMVMGRTGAARQPEDTTEPVRASNVLPGYRWDQTHKTMEALRRTDEGTEWLAFSDTEYWVHNYIRNAEGQVTLLIHARHERYGRPDEIEEHALDLGVVGGGGRELRTKLSSIMLHDRSGREIAGAYLRDYASYLKRTQWEIQTYKQFGWLPGNEFLMGDRVITPTEEREVRLGGQAAQRAGVFDVSNPTKEWIDVVDRVYNRPNGEPYQFVICASLGSALVPLLALEEFSGIPIAVTSDESGYGKTTVSWVALSAWGAVRRGLNALSGDEASLISIEWQASIFNNMPTLFDEQTNRDGVFTSNLLYMLSNGTARARGRPDGQLREMAPSWKGMHFITGNRNILSKLCEAKANPEAAQMRVFEISLDNYPRLDTLDHAQDISMQLNKIRSGYGQIGVDFIRYVMANREEVTAALQAIPRHVFKTLNHDKERFYIYAATCAIAAGSILQKLGYIQFDMKNLTRWTNSHIKSLRGSVDEMRLTTEDSLSRYLSTVVGNLLVTSNFTKGNQSHSPLYPIRGEVMGRIAYEEKKAYFSQSSMIEWCQDAGVQWHKFRASLAGEGFLGDGMWNAMDRRWETNIRVNLSKGVTGFASGAARVIELRYDRIAEELERQFVRQDNIIQMNK